jgi:hypothetical protein
MRLEEDFDADEVLRDVGDKYSDADADDSPENVRELNFGSIHDSNANFSDMADDLENLQGDSNVKYNVSEDPFVP